ncbi:ELMO domain-containing protein B [Cajanus cajan]|uniref:ELMO domain-containing protein A n=1 Tax=Cajanus cajan TaxID=3821 RepID=A0A151TAD6_CAJCA|nr:ELMO domain-containing protein B [Cajanus cajan]XP_029127856.1 ELMO domain-containing protein B [Cajanus cajan]KYP64012.1 ELMO domain-containing protein A [Cajanus cajan]
MSSRTLRRRLHHGDVDGKRQEHFETSGLDSLNEPLLTDDDYVENKKICTLEDLWDDERKKAQFHWTFIFSSLIAQWAQWLATIVLGSGSLLGRLLSFPSVALNMQNNRILPSPLSPLQEERLRSLRRRIEVPFDGSKVEHQDALKQLWKLAYPDRELPSLKSDLWKEMGWQGSDPSTDFRGGGFVSLENLIFFAGKYPDSFQRLLHKQDGTRAEWEYPFAVAGINISFMLAQMLDLQTGLPSSSSGVCFLKLLEEDEMAFDILFCIAFQMMDAQWLSKRATYMEFNDVLKSTRAQLENELALDDISSVRDLPTYNILR